MSFEIISTEKQLQKVIPQWKSLASDSYIFMSPDWLLNWWKCYKNENLQLHLYSLWDNDELKALFPLMLERSGSKILLRFLSNSCSDYMTIIIKNNNLSYIDFFVDQLSTDDSWDELFLNNIKEEDEIFDYVIKRLVESNFAIVIRKHDETAKIRINCTWNDFIRSRSHNTQRAYGRSEKSCKEFQFHVFLHYNQDIVNELFTLHENRWKTVNHSSVFSDGNRRKFFHQVALSFSKKNEMILFTLYSKNKIIAYRFGFVKENTYYDWNTSFDPAYAKFSCGKVLIKKIYEYCFEKGIKSFDFLKGLEPYKKGLMTSRSYLYSISCERKKINIKYLPPKEKIKEKLACIRGVIFDLDGVVYSGKKPIIDTISMIEQLRHKGIEIGFLTNTSAKSICEIQNKLSSMGVNTRNCFFMTSAVATGRYLKEIQCKTCVVFGGGEPLLREITRNGIVVLNSNTYDFSKVPSAIVIGYTTDFTYEDFMFCADMINKGSRFICTDKDNKFAHDGSWLPGTGWIVSSLEWVTSQHATIIGKPKTISLEYIIEEMQLNMENLLMIGDNVDTDILAAKAVGMTSCLLIGGISKQTDVAKMPNNLKPDIVVDSLLQINNYFKEV